MGSGVRKDGKKGKEERDQSKTREEEKRRKRLTASGTAESGICCLLLGWREKSRRAVGGMNACETTKKKSRW